MIENHLSTGIPKPDGAYIPRDESSRTFSIGGNFDYSRKIFAGVDDLSTRGPIGETFDGLEIKKTNELDEFLIKKNKKYQNEMWEMNLEEAEINVEIDNLGRELSWTKAQSVLMKKMLNNLDIDERNLSTNIDNIVKERSSELSRLDLEYQEVLMGYEKKLKMEQEAFEHRAKNFQETAANYCY